MTWMKEGDLLWGDGPIKVVDPTIRPPYYKLNMGNEPPKAQMVDDPEIIIGYTPNGVLIVRRKSVIENMILDRDVLHREAIKLRKELIGNKPSLELKVDVQSNKLHISITDKENVGISDDRKRDLALKNLKEAHDAELEKQRDEYLQHLAKIREDNMLKQTVADMYNEKGNKIRTKRNPNIPDVTTVMNPENKEIIHLRNPLSFRLAHYMKQAEKTEAVNALHSEFGNDWLAKVIFVLSSKQYPITDWEVNKSYACTLFNDNTVLIYKKPVPVVAPPEPEKLWVEEDLVVSQLQWNS